MEVKTIVVMVKSRMRKTMNKMSIILIILMKKMNIFFVGKLLLKLI